MILTEFETCYCSQRAKSNRTFITNLQMSSKFQFLGINFTQQLKDKEEPPNLEVLFVIHLDVFVVSKIIRVDCDDVTGKQDKSG